MNKPIRETLQDIERVRPDGGEWCTDEKAATLASLIFAYRPVTIVEIGVWLGGSFVPMAMALKALGEHEDPPGVYQDRLAIAIDPWEATASTTGQTGANLEWWGQIDHEQAFQTFCGRIADLELWPVVKVERKRSDDVQAPHSIDLLHIDGNHGAQAIADVKRYLPSVPVGGFVFLDDLGWDGGHVGAAADLLTGNGGYNFGCVKLYNLDTGALFQRVRS